MKTSFKFAGAGIALVFAGCAAMDWGTHLAAFKYTPGEQDAVVIVGGGSATTCVGNPTGVRILEEGERSHFYVKGITGFNSPMDTSLYKDHQGVLTAMRLEPGSYYAVLWPFNGMIEPIKPPHFQFTVAAGEVIYLGELYLGNGCDLNNRVTVRDEFDRDMALLKAQNPGLAKASIQKRVPAIPQ